MMLEFDLIMHSLQHIIKENLYCEDGELHIKNKLKYDIINLMTEIDKSFMLKLFKELEYEEES